MNTLANHFGDYRCEAGKSELNIILTVMYSSSVLGYLLMTLLGGVIGRKSLMISSLFLTLVGILVTIFCVNVVMAGVGLFVSFVGIQNGFNVCFYFLS
jgi:MFS family permease